MPALERIDPQGIEQGTDQQMTIFGDGFVAGTTVDLGAGIDISAINVTDVTITFTATAHNDAALGMRDVTVTVPNNTPLTITGGVVVTNFQSLLSQLRNLVGERIPAGKTDADTMFTDAELMDVVWRHSGNLYLAAAELWSAKAAERANLVDISESGSERKLSQLFKQAQQMTQQYQAAGEQISSTLIQPVVARVASPLSERALYGKPVVDPVFDPYYDPFVFLNVSRFWPRLTNFSYWA